MNPHVCQIIEAKREWCYTPSEKTKQRGFDGWRSRGYLPHFDAPGLVQMITYRLHDAMPAARRAEWAALLAIEDERGKWARVEAYLDRGYGECRLREPRVAAIVQENLIHGDGQLYRLLAWAIMPNHVHAVIEMSAAPLARVLHSWKSYTASAANKVLGRHGDFWQLEYYDRFARDAAHLQRMIHYVEANPRKAGLVRGETEWPWCSAALRAGAQAALPACPSKSMPTVDELQTRQDEARPATALAKLRAETEEQKRAGKETGARVALPARSKELPADSKPNPPPKI